MNSHCVIQLSDWTTQNDCHEIQALHWSNQDFYRCLVAAGSGQAMKAAKHFMQKSTVRLMLQGRNGKNENNITLSILSDATLILIQWII